MKDTEIIEAIRQGDEKAIGFVMDRYARLLWKVVGAVLLPSATAEDAEECVADVFVHLWQHPEQFDPGRGSLKTWLTIRARSRALDRSRELMRRQELPLEESIPAMVLALEESLLAREQREALGQAMEQMSEPEREVLLRRYLYCQKPRQIAMALDLPVKSVDNRLYRAKQKLRELLISQNGGAM